MGRLTVVVPVVAVVMVVMVLRVVVALTSHLVGADMALQGNRGAPELTRGYFFREKKVQNRVEQGRVLDTRQSLSSWRR